MGNILQQILLQTRYINGQQVYKRYPTSLNNQGEPNQSHSKITLHLLGWPLPKQKKKIADDKNPHTKHTKNNKCWQGCGEVRTPVHFWWIVKCKTEVLKIKKKTKNKTTI